MATDEIDRAIQALQAVKFYRDTYASSPDGCQRVRDIVEQLRLTDHHCGRINGLCGNLADAIERTYFGQASKAA